jgi:hypothetical protein
LEQAIIELPRLLAVGRPALAKLNRAFPALRAFAREALPGTKAANKALDAANPWIGQLRQLVSKPELRGLVNDLRPTIPDLAALAQASVPFLEESRALSSCFNTVVIPWSNTPIPNNDSDPPAAEVYKETGYNLVGVGGESRSGDANGQAFRVLGGGGPNTVSFGSQPELGGADVVGVVPFPILGAEPAKQSSAKTPFRPDVACETQEPPNLGTIVGPGPTTTRSGVSQDYAPPAAQEQIDEYAQIFADIMKADELRKDGDLRQSKEIRIEAIQDLAAWEKNGRPAYEKAINEAFGGGG